MASSPPRRTASVSNFLISPAIVHGVSTINAELGHEGALALRGAAGGTDRPTRRPARNGRVGQGRSWEQEQGRVRRLCGAASRAERVAAARRGQRRAERLTAADALGKAFSAAKRVDPPWLIFRAARPGAPRRQHALLARRSRQPRPPPSGRARSKALAHGENQRTGRPEVREAELTLCPRPWAASPRRRAPAPRRRWPACAASRAR